MCAAISLYMTAVSALVVTEGSLTFIGSERTQGLTCSWVAQI